MQVSIKKLVNNTGQIEGVPANPRQINKEDYNNLLKSLKEDPDFLVHKPLHVYEHNGKYVVLGGNQRLRALKELGYEEVPVTVYDKTTPVETLKARIIKDNSAFGEYDFDMLGNEWSDEPLTDWGVDLPEDWLEPELEQEPEIEEDEAPEVDESEPPKSKLGEIYQLGRHRVMCGDSTDVNAVKSLVCDSLIDMVYTDPPYGIDHSGKGIEGVALGNDFGVILGDKDVQIAKDAYSLSLGMYPESSLIFWGANYYSSVLPDGFGWIIWDKQREGETFSGAEIAFANKGVKVDVFRHQWHGMIKASEHGESRVHPTQKPIALAMWCFDNYGNPKTVLDLFLGSGSTLIACEQTDRTCYGMELDPKYVDVIRKRYHKFVTGSEEGWENETPAI